MAYCSNSLLPSSANWTNRFQSIFSRLPPACPALLPPTLLPSPALSPLRLRMCSKRLASSSHRVPVEEGSEALDQRTGSDRRSARDLERHSSSMERAHLRHRPPYSRRSPGRREPCHQSQAVPAAALPLSKR